MDLKRYRTLIKGDSMVDYDLQSIMDEFVADTNKAYMKMLSDNNLDPAKYKPCFSKPEYDADDFENNKFTVLITAVPIELTK